MYRCLQRILPGYFIATEWQHDRSDRVDFYLPRDRLEIQSLLNGTPDEIVEHLGRFDETLCGKYSKWGIIDDYLVINFCSSSKYKDLTGASKLELLYTLCFEVDNFIDKTMDQTRFPKLIQVIYDQQEQTLKVYSADHQPKCSPIILSEADHTSSMKGGDYPAR